MVTLWERPSSDGKGFTYYLLFNDENGVRRQRSLGHADKRKAERQRDKFERQLRLGMVEPSSLKIKDFVNDSLARTGDQIRESTRNEYASGVKDFIKRIGKLDVRDVTLAHGEKYRQLCLDHGNSPATVTKKLKHLKRLFQLGVNRRQLDENPLKFVDTPKMRKKKIRIYSEAECQSILKVAREYSLEWDRNIDPNGIC